MRILISMAGQSLYITRHLEISERVPQAPRDRLQTPAAFGSILAGTLRLMLK